MAKSKFKRRRIAEIFLGGRLFKERKKKDRASARTRQTAEQALRSISEKDLAKFTTPGIKILHRKKKKRKK